MAYAVVLGDGETFEMINDGTKIINIPDNITHFDDMDKWICEGDYASINIKELMEILDKLYYVTDLS